MTDSYLLEILSMASGKCPSTIRNNAKPLLKIYLDGNIDEAKRVKNPLKTIP